MVCLFFGMSLLRYVPKCLCLNVYVSIWMKKNIGCLCCFIILSAPICLGYEINYCLQIELSFPIQTGENEWENHNILFRNHLTDPAVR